MRSRPRSPRPQLAAVSALGRLLLLVVLLLPVVTLSGSAHAQTEPDCGFYFYLSSANDTPCLRFEDVDFILPDGRVFLPAANSSRNSTAGRPRAILLITETETETETELAFRDKLREIVEGDGSRSDRQTAFTDLMREAYTEDGKPAPNPQVRTVVWNGSPFGTTHAADALRKVLQRNVEALRNYEGPINYAPAPASKPGERPLGAVPFPLEEIDDPPFEVGRGETPMRVKTMSDIYINVYRHGSTFPALESVYDFINTMAHEGVHVQQFGATVESLGEGTTVIVDRPPGQIEQFAEDLLEPEAYEQQTKHSSWSETTFNHRTGISAKAGTLSSGNRTRRELSIHHDEPQADGEQRQQLTKEQVDALRRGEKTTVAPPGSNGGDDRPNDGSGSDGSSTPGDSGEGQGPSWLPSDQGGIRVPSTPAPAPPPPPPTGGSDPDDDNDPGPIDEPDPVVDEVAATNHR